MAKTGKRKIVNKSKKVKRSDKKTKRVIRRGRKTRKIGGEKTCTELFEEDQSFNLKACLESKKAEKARLEEIIEEQKKAEQKKAEQKKADLKALTEEYEKKKKKITQTY
jgi:tRNA G18 (ribose-2'-O)-methylase SpoU